MTPDRLERSLMISLALHMGLASLLFLRAVFVPDALVEIRTAIRVDVVDLPEKMESPVETLPPIAKPESASSAPVRPQEPAQPLPKAPPPKAETPKLPSHKIKKVDLAKAQNKALKELRKREALDRIQEQLAKGRAAEAKKQVKGNRVATGDSLTGLERLDFERYYAELRQKIRTNFTLPQWLADSGLKAQIQVLIDDQGQLIKKNILKSSGNEVFDAKAQEAIEASLPLPAPPQRLRSVLSTSGIVFGFPE
jgi:TonB family protein